VVRAWSNGLVSGGAGNDRLSGWSNSLVDGGDGADLISVWAGSTARGGAGDDAIYTSVDANVTGGTGDDLISVGGNSVVNFDAGDGKDTVYANRPTVLNFGEGITADKTHVTMSDRHTATITFDGSDDQIALNLGWSGSGHALRRRSKPRSREYSAKAACPYREGYGVPIAGAQPVQGQVSGSVLQTTA
jgi:hypothetical protein